MQLQDVSIFVDTQTNRTHHTNVFYPKLTQNSLTITVGYKGIFAQEW